MQGMLKTTLPLRYPQNPSYRSQIKMTRSEKGQNPQRLITSRFRLLMRSRSVSREQGCEAVAVLKRLRWWLWRKLRRRKCQQMKRRARLRRRRMNKIWESRGRLRKRREKLRRLQKKPAHRTLPKTKRNILFSTLGELSPFLRSVLIVLSSSL